MHYWSVFIALQAGAGAGTVTDFVLFPLDTIKTRLQSSKGFMKAGGFHRIYSGILPTVLGSAPSGKSRCTLDSAHTYVNSVFFNDTQLLLSSVHMN